MKKVLLFILLFFPLAINAQTSENIEKYLEGAVPVKNGYVSFMQEFDCHGLSTKQIFNALVKYSNKTLIDGKNHLPKSRITEADSLGSLLVLSMEEYIYFKRKAWTMDRARFYYQLIYRINDGKFSVEMRRIGYQYDDVPNTEYRHAEDWITDDVALTPNKKSLAKRIGKHRKCIIDRKDEIFIGAHNAVMNLKNDD